jgi:hypothetical protein
MPRLRPKALCLLVCLLLAPLLPPSTAQAGTTSATFSVGIRIVPRNAVAGSQSVVKQKAIKGGAPETSKTVASGKSN